MTYNVFSGTLRLYTTTSIVNLLVYFQGAAMGEVWRWMKANFIPFHLIFGYVFVVSGLIVCFLMLLTYLFVWPLNKTLYRKIVVNLVYTHWCRKFKLTLLVVTQTPSEGGLGDSEDLPLLNGLHGGSKSHTKSGFRLCC